MTDDSRPSPRAEPDGSPSQAFRGAERREASGEEEGTVRWGMGQVAYGYVVAVVVSGVFASIALAIAPEDEDWPGVVGGSLGIWVGFIGAPFVATWFLGRRSFVADFGLTQRWMDALIGLPLGVAVQALVLPALYWVLGHFVDTSSISDPAEKILGDTSGLGAVLVVLTVGFGAPIAEELFFRGLFQRAAVRRLGRNIGVGFVAVAFAGTHFQLLQFPGLLVAGVVFGVAAQASGRLGPAIWTHIGFNMTAAVVLVT